MVGDLMDEGDELIERASSALRTMPRTPPMAMARIVAAVRARRAMAPSRFTLLRERLREPSLSMASAGWLAAAALLIGFVSRGAIGALNEQAPGATVAAPSEPTRDVPLLAAADAAGAVRAVPVNLVFDASGASEVVIVGDFNSWDATASPMRRVGTDGPWAVTVLAKPGRHLYAFLVDGTTLVADPRAPKARDLDYGGVASVMMVAAP